MPDPENRDESAGECDDPCRNENDQLAPCADQCCGVGISCLLTDDTRELDCGEACCGQEWAFDRPSTDACAKPDDARALDCGGSCCGQEIVELTKSNAIGGLESKEDGARQKSCRAPECPAADACAGLDDAEEFGCGGSCCGQEIAESATLSAVDDGREPKKGDACQRPCCASEVSLPAAECEVVAVAEPKALADASDSSPPLQTFTVRRRIAKQGHDHHHKGKPCLACLETSHLTRYFSRREASREAQGT